MTVSGDLAAHGNPDWQPERAVADTKLMSVSGVNTSGSVDYGPFFVGNFPGLGLDFLATAGRVILRAQWFFDQALTTQLNETFIRSAPGQRFNGTIAVKGPYVRLRATDETGAGSTFELAATLHRHLGMEQGAAEINILVGYTNQSVAAGATRTDIAPRVWPGAASLFFDSTATLGLMAVEELDAGGVWNTFFRVAPTVLVLPCPIYLPAAPVRLRVVNSDGAAKNFSAFLVAEPHLNRD